MLRDSPWGRLEPGHWTRNLHGFVLSVYREGRREWCPTVDGDQRGLNWPRTLREAKRLAEAEAQGLLDDETGRALMDSLKPGETYREDAEHGATVRKERRS